MKIKQITETTTAGAIATTETALGGTQSRGNPSIYGGKKVGTLFKGKKTSAPYANSINESAELSEAQLEEDDVIVVPGQGRSRKNGLVPHGQSRLDHEVEMARSDLFSAAKNAQQVYSMIKDVSEDEGLDGWVQEKIIKANDYLNTIREYLEGKQVQGVAEGTDNVDSLVTDTEAVMKKFKMDATQELTTQALKIVLGEREYKDRPGYYYSFIRQIIARSKQQGLAEGRLDELGNTDAGRKALRAVQKRGGDEITAWNKKPESGYSPTPTNAAKHFDASVSAGNRLYGHGPNTLRKDTVLARDAMRRYHKGEPITPEEVKIISKWYPGFKVEEGVKGQQGVAEGSRNAYLKHNNLVDIEKPLAGLKSEFEKFLQTHDPKEKQKYQQGIKQRIKSDPMSGPKGVLPEQGVTEGVADMHSDELLNTVRDAIRKAIKETGDQSLSKIFVCLRSAIPASEALKNITSPISLEAVDNALQEVGIDFDDLLNFINKQAEKYGKQGVAEGAKVDRMVKHIEKSEKKLGKSKDEAENIAWATANKRGMLDNKNKKA